MNKNQRTSVVLVVLIVVALIVSFLGIHFLQPLERPFERPFEHRPVLPPTPGDIELYYLVRTMLTTINVALLIFLFATYLGIYRKIKSDFTIGLMVFSMVLLLYALSSNPLVQYVFGFRAFGLGPFAMLPDLFTSVALAVLLYLTFRY